MVANTFHMDFKIAERFGLEAIIDTYERCQEWRSNVQMYTALVLNLNWLIWEHYEAGNMKLAKLYDELWRKADEWACENFKGEDARYYFQETD